MEKVIKTLNTLLKGEQMAVEVYGGFLRQIHSDQAKDTLTDIRQDHSRHLGMVSDRIVALGGDPGFGTGAAGVFSDVKQTIQTAAQLEDRDILAQALDGERMGVDAEQKLLREPLDTESTLLVQRIFAEDQAHLQTLRHLQIH